MVSTERFGIPMSMLNNLIKMIMADPAAVAELQAMTAAPTARKVKGKKTLTDEQKAKMAAGRKAASAARAAATGKPAPEPVVEAAKPAKVKGKGKGKAKFGKVEAGQGQRDRKGRVWVPMWIDGEFAGSMRKDVARAMFIAIRSENAGALLTHVESQG